MSNCVLCVCLYVSHADYFTVEYNYISMSMSNVDILLWNIYSYMHVHYTMSQFTSSAWHTGRLWLNLCQNSRNIVFAKIWHSMALMALQDTKKPIEYWKRPTKAEKVILKAGESKNGKIMIFFHFCDHLVSKIKGIQYFDVSRSKRPKRPH